MSIIDDRDQSQVDQLALDYVQLHAMKVALKLARERGDRLQKSLLAAVMHAECGDYYRVKEILYQALNS